MTGYLLEYISDVDPENGTQKLPGGRSHAHMTTSTPSKTQPTEARYFAGVNSQNIVRFLKISN